MKKMLASLGIGALSLAATSSSFAATFSPANTTRTFSGAMAVEQITPLNCAVALTVKTNATATAADVISGWTAPGDFQCAYLSPTFNPVWSITPYPSSGIAGAPITNVRVSPFKAISLGGTCGTTTSNTVEATFINGSPDRISVNRLPGVDGVALGSPARCYFSGTLTSTDGVLSFTY